VRIYSWVAVLCLTASGCSQPETAAPPPKSTDAPSIAVSPQPQPKTLEAAVAASQEKNDRFVSGDFAGEWLLFSKQVRDAVSQADYVRYSQRCDDGSISATTTGVRMEGTDKAIVRIEAFGVKDSRTMVYEDGQWVQAPTEKMAQKLGKPVDQWACPGSSAPTTTMPIAPSNTTAPPLTEASTSDVSAPRTSERGHLVAVRMARQNGYDRMVLEFTDLVPGYKIGYRPLPMYQDPSGAEIPLAGANSAVRIELMPATGSGTDPGERTYFGPSTVTGDTAVLTEAKAAGDFEAVLSWVVGLRSEVPFRATVLAEPPRLVIDFMQSTSATPTSTTSAGAGAGAETPYLPNSTVPQVETPAPPNVDGTHAGCTWVDGYTKSNGTHVRGHWRC
jgi:hypothetical protein